LGDWLSERPVNSRPINRYHSNLSGQRSTGGGPAADSQGNIYDLIGNDPFDQNLNSLGFPSNGDIGDTFVKWTTTPTFAVADYFAPYNQQTLANGDLDLGSGGPLLLPDMIDASGNVRHLAAGAGKDGNIYLVDRDNLGKINLVSMGNPNIYQELAGALPLVFRGCPAYFNGSLYYGPQGQSLKQFTFTAARLNSAPASQSATVFNYPGTSPSISANGIGERIPELLFYLGGAVT
jgi:hypothetical protein